MSQTRGVFECGFRKPTLGMLGSNTAYQARWKCPKINTVRKDTNRHLSRCPGSTSTMQHELLLIHRTARLDEAMRYANPIFFGFPFHRGRARSAYAGHQLS